MTRNAILLEDRAALGVHVQFQLFFEHSTYVGLFIVVLGGMEYRPAAPRNDSIPNHLARRVFHCGYNTFLVKTPNVHVARYKLLHGAFVKKQYFLPLSESNVDDVWQGPVSFSL